MLARLGADVEIDAALVVWLDEEFALPGAAELAGGVALCGTVPAGAGGFGAETPAMSDPSPSFCKLGASSLPVASIPFAD